MNATKVYKHSEWFFFDRSDEVYIFFFKLCIGKYIKILGKELQNFTNVWKNYIFIYI